MLCLILLYSVFFFFFKQKTAYEMRISDWSSDVCSSDLSRLFEGSARLDIAGDRLDPDRESHRTCRGPGAAIRYPDDDVRTDPHLFRDEPGRTASGSLFESASKIPHALCHYNIDGHFCISVRLRSEEHTSELQSLMRTSYS